MESIKELREKLQGEKFALRTNVWGYKVLRRGISIYVTRILIPTSIKPNHITVLMILVGIAAAAAIVCEWLWLGFALAYINIVLDAVDGELARYKKMFSLPGIYLDRINHLLIPGLILLATVFAVGDIWNNPNPLFIIFGVLGAFVVPISLSNGYLHYQLYMKPYSETPELFPHVQSKSKNPSGTLSSQVGLGAVAQVAYQLGQFVVMVLVFAIGYGVETYMHSVGHPILMWLVGLYAALYIVYFIRGIIGGFYTIEKRVTSLGH